MINHDKSRGYLAPAFLSKNLVNYLKIMGRLKDHLQSYADYFEISFEDAMDLDNETVLNWKPPAKISSFRLERALASFYQHYEIDNEDRATAWKFVIEEFGLSLEEETELDNMIYAAYRNSLGK